MVSDDPVLTELLRKALDQGTPVTFRAKGASMSPFIRDGDRVTVSPREGAIRRGEVALMIHPTSGKLMIHRVVKEQDGRPVTSGDNAPHGDGPIPEQNLLGCVTKVQRQGREVSLGLGPERSLIAFLNGKGLLVPLLEPLRKLVRRHGSK